MLSFKKGPPQAPTDLQATTLGGYRVELNWDSHSNNELGFEIYRATGAGSFELIAVTNGGISSYLDIHSLAPGNTYRYKIRATNSLGQSAYTNVATVTTPTSQVNAQDFSVFINFSKDYLANAPWNNTAKAPVLDDVFTNLKDGNNNNSGFSIKLLTRWTNVFSNGPQTGNNSGIFPDNVLKEYYYFGIHGGPDTVKLKISGLIQGLKYNFRFLGGSIWTGVPNNGSTVYAIGNTNVPLAVQNNVSNTAFFKGFSPNENGEIFITAYKAQGTSVGYLNAMVIEAYEPGPPSAPKDLVVTALSSHRTKLKWRDISNNESGYQIYRGNGNGTNFQLIATTQANEDTYIDSENFQANTSYTYKVRAINSDGVSSFTGDVPVTTLPFNSSLKNYSVKINFNHTNNVASPWNNTAKTPAVNDNFPNLLDNTSQSSPVGMTLLSNWGGSFAGGAITGNNSGVFPDNVLQSYYYFGIHGGPPVVRIKIHGLSQATSYDFTFLSNSIWRGPPDNGTTTYTIGQKTATLKVENNTTNTARILNVVPNEYGEVLIDIGKESDAQAGFINAMVIHAKQDNTPDDPTQLVAKVISYESIELTWEDNSHNETGFEIFRATEASGPYQLIHTTTANQTSYRNVGLADGTAYYYKIRAKNNERVSEFSSLASASTPNDYKVDYSVLVNFNLNVHESAPWNNTAKAPAINDYFTNLANDKGNISTIGIRLLTSWGGLFNAGASSSSNTGVFPNNVLKEYYYFGIFGAPDVVTLKIDGLDKGRLYDFKFMGSSIWGGAPNNGTTIYSINGQSVPLAVQNNTQNLAIIKKVAPDANGEVLITLSKAEGTPAGYLNALVIEAHAPKRDPNLTNRPTDAAAPSVQNSNPHPPYIGGAVDINFVRVFTPRKEFQNASQVNINSQVKDVQILTTYFDGLGRPVQTVLRKESPMERDIIQPIAYDAFGRQPKEYLPYTISAATPGSYRPGALYEQYQFYHNASNVAHTHYPYAEKKFEASPLNRVLAQAGPGESWHLNSGKALQFSERTNKKDASESIRIWKVVNGLPQSTASYDAGQLYVQETKDEHQKIVLEYKDKQGRVVLKKVQEADAPGPNHTGYLCTYYIYDDLNNLRYVLPPEAIRKTFINAATINIAQPFLDLWAFQYQYDGRQRMTAKHVPGAGWVYMVYDQWDRLVLSQDGVQRSNNEWHFTKYDALNRPVVTGKYVEAITNLSQLRIQVHSWTGRHETTTAGGPGYTLNQTFPANVTEANLLTITYYDGYSFPHAGSTGFDYVSQFTEAGYEQAFGRVKGLPTGSRVRVLEKDGTMGRWLRSVNYYDKRYQLIQVISENNQNGRDRVSSLYDFEGKIQETKHRHEGFAIHDIVSKPVYDHAGRLKSISHKLDNKAPVTLAKHNYNELGELIRKDLHANEGHTPMQQVKYKYNIRGWLTHINEVTQANSPDYFSMELYYGHGFEIPQYNGNITGVKWKNAIDREQHAYGYFYDNVNRITGSDYAAKGSNWKTGAKGVGNFNLDFVDYDANGNIQHLKRYGLIEGARQVMDDLTYSYKNGNQLSKVDDAGVQEGFKDGINTGDDYGYDANGNMKEDKNKGITQIKYNHLNLPGEVIMEEGKKIEYVYDASGVKLQQKVYENGSLVKTSDYSGSYYYENGSLQFIHHAEGRVVMSPEGGEYQYHLKDHLGNVRVTFTSDPKPVTDVATMERAKEEEEWQQFLYYDQVTRINSALFDHTNAGGQTRYSIRLSGVGKEKIGLAKSLQVLAGDKISATVYAKYLDPNSNNWTTALANFMAAIANGTAPAGTVLEGVPLPPGQGYPFPGSLDRGPVLDNGPKAYLNVLIFDKDFNYLNGHFVKVKEEAKENGSNVAHQQLSLENITINQPGFVYIYLSNDQGEPVEVYFDDFQVTHTPMPVVQGDDYYPFGLTFNGFRRENKVGNSFQYMGVENNRHHDYNIYETVFRSYDPALGRFSQIDLLAHLTYSLNPYQYANNDPIYYNDPLGLTANSGLTGNPGFNYKTWKLLSEAWGKVPDGQNRVFDDTGIRGASYAGGGYLYVGGYFGENGEIVENSGIAGAFEIMKVGEGSTTELGFPKEGDDSGLGSQGFWDHVFNGNRKHGIWDVDKDGRYTYPVVSSVVPNIPVGPGGGKSLISGLKNLKHLHHSYPQFLGGLKNQKLTKMTVDAHKALHKELNAFLKQFGMAPSRSNPGRIIRRDFTPEQIKQALIEFYKGPGAKYTEAAKDFFNYIGF